MFNRKLATTLAAVLLSASAAAQAATSAFPQAAEEGSEYSVNAAPQATLVAAGGANPVFPSAGVEGSESRTQLAVSTTPRNLELSFARASGGVFPAMAME